MGAAKSLLGVFTQSTFISAPLTVGQLTTGIATLADAANSGEIKPSDIPAITSAVIGAVGSVGALAALPAAAAGIAGTPLWLAGLGLSALLGVTDWLLDKYGDQLADAL